MAAFEHLLDPTLVISHSLHTETTVPIILTQTFYVMRIPSFSLSLEQF